MKEQPNVILILADDMGYGDLSCINGGASRTPNLDALAAGGVAMSQAYSASCVCAPARAALLTGRYPHRTNVVSLGDSPHLMRMHTDERTLADLYRANGYATGLIGKWHCGTGDPYHPLKRGFQEFCGWSKWRLEDWSYWEYTLEDGGMPVPSTGKYLTDELSERAVDFVHRHRDRPFFLHLAHFAPHRPLGAPDALVQPYIERGIDRNTATIYAMVEVMDTGIGRLLETLKDLGLEENTLVVFSSDNGPDPLTGERFNCGLSGSKYTVNEGGIRVPLILRWPGVLKPGVHHDFIHFVDLLPTLASICGLEHTEGLPLDGVDLAASLTGATHCPHPTRFWQWNRGVPCYSHNAAMRDGPWKLVRPCITRGMVDGESLAPVQLFNLDDDPCEKHDLAAEQPQRVMAMREALERWAESVERDRRRCEPDCVSPTAGRETPVANPNQTTGPKWG